jgi:membrane protease YdiL (CAAX protease family)
MSYRPHETLVAPARESASLLRLIGGIVTLVAGFIAFGLMASRLQWAFVPAERHAEWSEALYDASTPTAVLVNLFFFGLLIIALALITRLFHKRSWTTLIGRPALAVHQFLRVSMYLISLSVMGFLLPVPEVLQPSLNLAIGIWVLYLPLTLLGLLLQTGAEELVFRGYLQSQLAARFRSPLVWMMLPSAIFGMLHFNPGVDETAALLVVLWAFAFGLTAADLTARTGTLGPALALHMVNNFVAIALVAPEGSFDGLAVYTIPFSMSDTDLLLAWMPVEMMMLLCSWLAARLALRV